MVSQFLMQFQTFQIAVLGEWRALHCHSKPSTLTIARA